MGNRLLILFLLASGGAFAQKPVFTAAKMKSATVYFRAAELTQTASVLLAKGANEVVVKNVSDHLHESTLRIGTPPGVTVVSALFTTAPVIDGASAETKKNRDSIAVVEKSILALQTERETLTNSVELLDKNRLVSGSESGLKTDELIKMFEFYKKTRTGLNAEINVLDEKEKKLRERLTRLNARLQAGTEKDENISRGKLVLQVLSETAGKADFDVQYLTSGATWEPSYDLRAESTDAPLHLVYKAQVKQETGVDWKQVKLTLSSGTPTQHNWTPSLRPWFLRYTPQRPLVREKRSAVTVMSAAAPVAEADEAENAAETVFYSHEGIIEHQLSVSYEIDMLYDIPPNGRRNSVALKKEAKIPVNYRYHTVPRMESEAHLLAEVADYAQYNMLRGEANIVFEGMHVGTTSIDPNQTADTLRLNMGRDKRVSVKREKLADRSGTKFLSNAKQQTFTYEITVRNNKKDAVNLVVKDQYPLSTDKEIEVELLESSKAEVDKETGMLTWTADLKPNETRKFRLGYRVKYPKDRTLSNL